MFIQSLLCSRMNLKNLGAFKYFHMMDKKIQAGLRNFPKIRVCPNTPDHLLVGFWVFMLDSAIFILHLPSNSEKPPLPRSPTEATPLINQSLTNRALHLQLIFSTNQVVINLFQVRIFDFPITLSLRTHPPRLIFPFKS